MNRPLSHAILILGSVLIIYGIGASDSISSEFSRLFTGAPTDRTLWLFLGGLCVSLIGIYGVVRGPRCN